MKKWLMVILVLVSAVALLISCQSSARRHIKNGPYDPVPKFSTVDEVINWSEKNLYYENTDPWDPAPEIDQVLNERYGDCKMLAGAVSTLLDSVGKENLIIVIKRRGWHMFNAFQENGDWRVVNNARPVKRSFSTLDDVKKHFGVVKFEGTFHSYADFRKWFNGGDFSKEEVTTAERGRATVG